jgi:tetratricopeptide (TPR) repeat protein
MEVGSWYVRLGLLDEADSVFACAPSYPLAVMYRAWIAEQKGQCDDSRRLLAEALKLDPRWVLPFRPQSLKLLAWADSRSDDPKIDYYRGLILWRNIRYEEALAEFEKIGEFDFAPFFQARAELCKLLKKPYRADLERALAMEPSWRIYGALMDEAESRCAWNESIRYGEEGYAKFPECFTLALKLAGAYRSDGQYRKAIDLLEKVVVMPAEGSWLGRYIWRLANIQYAVELANSGKVDEASKYLANSYQWRETLGSGKPQDFRIDLRVEHFAEAMIAGKRGDLAARKKWLEKIAAITPSGTFQSREVIIAFALRELGKKDQAEQLISKWRTQNGNRKNDLLDCCLALYNGDYDTVRKLLVPAPKEDNVAVWHAPVRDTDMHIIVKIVMP